MRCRECGCTEGPFRKHASHKNSGICCKCHSDYCVTRAALKKAEKFPDNYFQCDNCDKVFSVFRPGNFKLGTQRKRNTNCTYCGSEEITTFREQEGTNGKRA